MHARGIDAVARDFDIVRMRADRDDAAVLHHAFDREEAAMPTGIEQRDVRVAAHGHGIGQRAVGVAVMPFDATQRAVAHDLHQVGDAVAVDVVAIAEGQPSARTDPARRTRRQFQEAHGRIVDRSSASRASPNTTRLCPPSPRNSSVRPCRRRRSASRPASVALCLRCARVIQFQRAALPDAKRFAPHVDDDARVVRTRRRFDAVGTSRSPSVARPSSASPSIAATHPPQAGARQLQEQRLRHDLRVDQPRLALDVPAQSAT